jgi:hypothetical protein
MGVYVYTSTHICLRGMDKEQFTISLYNDLTPVLNGREISGI